MLETWQGIKTIPWTPTVAEKDTAAVALAASCCSWAAHG